MKGKVILNKGKVHRNERDTVKANNTSKINAISGTKQGRKMKVPILITWDIDPLARDERIRYGIPLNEEQKSLLKKSLELASDLTSEHCIRSTFFVTASLCEEIEDELKELLKKGHQIGCHGLTH